MRMKNEDSFDKIKKVQRGILCEGGWHVYNATEVLCRIELYRKNRDTNTNASVLCILIEKNVCCQDS